MSEQQRVHPLTQEERDVREINRLWAQRDELLAALRDADDLLTNFLTWDDSRYVRVRAAITKAEGRQTPVGG